LNIEERGQTQDRGEKISIRLVQSAMRHELKEKVGTAP